MRKQKHFIQKEIVPLLSKFNHDQSLSQSDFKKITSYYGLAVPAIIGEGFCALRGKSMSLSERRQLTYLGGLSGLFDDFFDQKQTKLEHIQSLINNPLDENAKNAHELLFVKFSKMALSGDSNPDLLNYANQIFEAQVESKKQQNTDLTPEEIEEITIKKGGVAFLFYRCGFLEKISNEERELFYYIGGLGQLENDIFDVYEDHQEEIRTLATVETQLSHLRKKYISLYKKVLDLLEKTDFQKANKKKLSDLIALVFCRGMVCLDHYKKAENRTDGKFHIPSYSREELVCDMGKFRNQLKLYKYYVSVEMH